MAWAKEQNITVAGLREGGAPSLSPSDLARTELPDRLMLPSPNGAALTVAARDRKLTHVFAGSLRNARATASRANALADGPVAVIAAGELARDGSMRPAIEDLLGAGAIINQGFADDLPIAAELDTSSVVAVLRDGAYVGETFDETRCLAPTDT